jgi:hypothetical protein
VKGGRRVKSFARIVLIIVVLLIATTAMWALAYPSENDPKNFKYVLWKHELYAMNPDQAIGAMVGDTGRDKLVVGKTKAQLQQKFGYLKSPSDAGPYMKGCYLESSWKDQDVLIIRNGPWMVLFTGENATGLRLCKG